MSQEEKAEKARKWVNGYTATGAALVIGVAHVPGAATIVCISIETMMCYQIGKIYRGSDYSLHDAAASGAAIGLTTVTATLVAIEAASLLGPLGWPVKAPLSASLIKTLGEVIIRYFKSLDNEGK